MTSIDIYTVPRDQVDVEALSRQFVKYLQINAIDVQELSEHPQRRDAIIAELYARPETKPTFWPKDTVGADLPPEKYDEYLAQVDAAIEQLTPPNSLEDRVLRSHLASAAVMVVYQYKWSYALRAHPDLQNQVIIRYSAILNDWMKNEFRALYPKQTNGMVHNPATITPPTAVNPLSPPPTRHSGQPKAITDSEVGEYLKNPQTLLGKQFLHAPPVGVEQDYKGLWEADSYSVRMLDGRVDYEFLVRLEAFGVDLLPMGMGDMEFLLKHSTLVV
ncbi:hypothetical protein C2E23DRAFT_801048 [Lenzites betulinus]|nr:hypothetical protein C2E23DRAFT_801048 [Lenzites betulinus]